MTSSDATCGEDFETISRYLRNGGVPIDEPSLRGTAIGTNEFTQLFLEAREGQSLIKTAIQESEDTQEPVVIRVSPGRQEKESQVETPIYIARYDSQIEATPFSRNYFPAFLLGILPPLQSLTGEIPDLVPDEEHLFAYPQGIMISRMDNGEYLGLAYNLQTFRVWEYDRREFDDGIAKGVFRQACKLIGRDWNEADKSPARLVVDKVRRLFALAAQHSRFQVGLSNPRWYPGSMAQVFRLSFNHPELKESEDFHIELLSMEDLQELLMVKAS
jgi:hypothetical protein